MNIIAWDKVTDTAIVPERFPNDKEWACFDDYDGRVTKKQYNTPIKDVVISIVASVSKIEASIGDTITVTASFSDKTLNFIGVDELFVSIVNRDGLHLLNISMSVVNGEGVGGFIVDNAVDYCLTNAAINRWKDKIPYELVLQEEVKVRVK